MATTIYGVRIRVTPDTSGDNSPLASTVLYRSDTAGGAKSELARQAGTAVWYYDDERAQSSGKKYYYARTELLNMTSSTYIGPVDAEPADLSLERE